MKSLKNRQLQNPMATEAKLASVINNSKHRTQISFIV